MTDVAVIVETCGAVAMAFTAFYFAIAGRQPHRVAGLRAALAFLGLYGLTNFYYGIAYLGRTTERFELWDTWHEQIVRSAQLLCAWSIPILMLVAVHHLVKKEEVSIDANRL